MISKISDIYKSVALFILNTLLLLVIINIALYFFYRYKDRSLKKTNPVAQKYGMDKLRKAYPGLEEQEIDALLTETWNRPQQYRPFAGFKERPFAGAYVNVDSMGIRNTPGATEQQADTNALTVFIFGGSTTFGYGVADNQTIPAWLQKMFADSVTNKKVRCYNFGTGFYYSVQERVLFEDLLLKGIVPDAAIFIDGLNDFYFEDPFYSKETGKYFEQKSSSLFGAWLQSLPMTRLARSVSYRLFNTSSSFYDLPENCDPRFLRHVIERYLSNKKMIEAIAATFDVKTFFIWQPVSCYKYQPKENLFADKEGSICFPACGYEAMREYLKTHDAPEHFYWLADMQEGVEENLYADRNHYTSEMNRRIAAEIFRRIRPELLAKNPFSWIPSAIRENIKSHLRGVFQN